MAFQASLCYSTSQAAAQLSLASHTKRDLPRNSNSARRPLLTRLRCAACQRGLKIKTTRMQVFVGWAYSAHALNYTLKKQRLKLFYASSDSRSA